MVETSSLTSVLALRADGTRAQCSSIAAKSVPFFRLPASITPIARVTRRQSAHVGASMRTSISNGYSVPTECGRNKAEFGETRAAGGQDVWTTRKHQLFQFGAAAAWALDYHDSPSQIDVAAQRS